MAGRASIEARALEAETIRWVNAVKRQVSWQDFPAYARERFQRALALRGLLRYRPLARLVVFGDGR